MRIPLTANSDGRKCHALPHSVLASEPTESKIRRDAMFRQAHAG